MEAVAGKTRIEFFKQLLHSLQSQRRTRNRESNSAENQYAVSSSSSFAIAMASNGSDSRTEAADVEVNLKVQCERKPRQLVEAIVALEKLKHSVLHLNVTTSQSTVLYSFNLKISGQDYRIIASNFQLHQRLDMNEEGQKEEEQEKTVLSLSLYTESCHGRPAGKIDAHCIPYKFKVISSSSLVSLGLYLITV